MDNNPTRSSDSQPIYYEVSPRIVLGLRILGGVTALAVVISFIITLVRATQNSNFYMLTCNIILTSFVGLANVYWYRKGQLPPDKHWYMLLISLVIIWQCIATDIYVFHKLPDNPHPNSTAITT